MAVSYNGLWKLLIDKNMKKVDLMDQRSVISWNVISGILSIMNASRSVASFMGKQRKRIANVRLTRKKRMVDSNGIQRRIDIQTILAAGIQKDSKLYSERVQ